MYEEKFIPRHQQQIYAREYPGNEPAIKQFFEGELRRPEWQEPGKEDSRIAAASPYLLLKVFLFKPHNIFD
jgi:hypothetical protein